MNKTDLIDYVKTQTGLGKAECEKAVGAVFQGIAEALEKKEEVSFVGFGSFIVIKREARDGRNPRTGEIIQIPTSNIVKFRPGKGLKAKVA